jgi:hypothetical protein
MTSPNAGMTLAKDPAGVGVGGKAGPSLYIDLPFPFRVTFQEFNVGSI